jgi:hypothetical protein
MTSRDHRIAQIAGAQRGRVASRQLAEAGISSSTTSRLVARSSLFPLHRSVFAVGHTAPVELGDATAALLAVGGTAAVTHLSAAVLWALLPPDAGDGLIHVTTAEDHRPCLDGVIVHRTRSLTAADIRIRGGLPVLSPGRALLEIAELVTERRLEHGRRSHRPPLGGGGAVPRPRPPRRPSPAEGQLLRSTAMRLTFFWPRERCAVEIDGFCFHSTRRAFEHDRRKDAVLQAAGISTPRFTWRQLVQEPLAVVVGARSAAGPGLRAQRPLHCGSRFSKNARTPSWMSSVEKAIVSCERRKSMASS